MAMDTAIFLDTFPPTKYQLHNAYFEVLEPERELRDGFLVYIMLESKYFPALSYIFYLRKVLFDKVRQKKLLYYVCFDCWKMQSRV